MMDTDLVMEEEGWESKSILTLLMKCMKKLLI